MNTRLDLDHLERIRLLAPLRYLTLSQLRTFLFLTEYGTPGRVARELGFDQSSVRSQVKLLESHFEEFTQSKLIVWPSRKGDPIQLTLAGERVRELVNSVLGSFASTCSDLKRDIHERPVRLALTTFLIPVIAELNHPLQDAFARHGHRYLRDLVHIRTKELRAILLHHKEIDFALGGIVSSSVKEDSSIPDDQDFLTWAYDTFVLLSNFEVSEELSSARTVTSSISIIDILNGSLPMILPKQGVIRELLERVKILARRGTLEEVHVIEECDDVHFAIELLQLQIIEGCMLCTKFISKYARRRPGSEHLREYGIQGLEQELRIGLLRRKSDVEAYAENHPVRIFWRVFEEQAKVHAETIGTGDV